MFIGYPHGQRGWKVYNLQTHEFLVSRDVVFYENTFPYSPHEGNQETSACAPMFQDTTMEHAGGALDEIPEHQEEESLQATNKGETCEDALRSNERPRSTIEENTNEMVLETHSTGENQTLPNRLELPTRT